MFWRNQGFRNPFQRGNYIEGALDYGGMGYNPQLRRRNNQQLAQQQNQAGTDGSWRQVRSGAPRQPPAQNRPPYTGGQPMPQAPQMPPSPYQPRPQQQLMPQMPQAPQISQMPQMSQAPQMPQMPQMSQAPQLPQMSQAPQMPQMPQMSQAPQMPQLSQMPQIPQSNNWQPPQVPSSKQQALGAFGFSQPQAGFPSQAAPVRAPDALPGQGSDNPPESLNGLKNTGNSFMGYPEYTLQDADMSVVSGGTEGSQTLSGGMDNSAGVRPGDVAGPIFEALRELCQCERNGSDYYKSLAEKSINEKSRKCLFSISSRADSRSKRLMELHNSIANSDFSPESRNIKKDVGYFDGLRLAIDEESQTLRYCAEIAENAKSAALKERLNMVIIEKLCQLNELNALFSG